MPGTTTFRSAVLVVLAVLVHATAASAANWDPPNTTLHEHGTLTYATNLGTTFTCTYTASVKMTGDLAQTVNASGVAAAPQFSNCTNSISATVSTTVTSSSPWNATATSTTAVDISGNLVVNLGGGLCIITASGLSLANNVWNNSLHTLTLNSAATVPIVESGIFCDGGTSGYLSGSIALPNSVTIT